MLRTRTILYIYAPVVLIVLLGVVNGLAHGNLAGGLAAAALLFGAWAFGGLCFGAHERLEREERAEVGRRAVVCRRQILFPDDSVELYPHN